MQGDRWQAAMVVPPISEHAEGPLWDEANSRLMWVDQHRGVIRTLSYAEGGPGELGVIEVGRSTGAVVPAAAGGWMLAAGDGFAHLDESGKVTPVAAVLPADGISRRMNDGKVDPLGRFWAGTMANDVTPGAGSLYRLDADGAREVLEGVTISNGMAWSADGGTMFYIDTPTGEVRTFSEAADGSGELVRNELTIPISGEGGPDGMCIDISGNLWVAIWGASAVHCYSQAGELLGVVEVDAPQASSCAFGGPDYATLFITTSRDGYGPEEEKLFPNAGAIFAVQTGAVGLPAHAFAG